MTRQQMNYIKECLALRRRRLEERFCPYPEKPQEVLDAEALIEKWRRDSAHKRSALQNAIRNKIQEIEEQLILGGIEGSMPEVLALLDSWTPEVAQ